MLEDEFDKRMQEVYRAGKIEARYSAPLFASMLQELGGLETARRFIHSPAAAPGVYVAVGAETPGSDGGGGDSGGDEVTSAVHRGRD